METQASCALPVGHTRQQYYRNTLMTKQDIIEKLQNGWDLANRGRGWWISAPHIAYKHTETYEIEESIVKAMKN
jgi:hypothetical protein